MSCRKLNKLLIATLRVLSCKCQERMRCYISACACSACVCDCEHCVIKPTVCYVLADCCSCSYNSLATVQYACVCMLSARGAQSFVYYWSSYPSLLYTVLRCPELPFFLNGAIITYDPDMIAPYDVDTVATHTCNEGFVLVAGSETRVCLLAGRWSGLARVCQRT